jgi:hypothetical protein
MIRHRGSFRFEMVFWPTIGAGQHMGTTLLRCNHSARRSVPTARQLLHMYATHKHAVIRAFRTFLVLCLL